jgi:UDP-glucose 4-epimerase
MLAMSERAAVGQVINAASGKRTTLNRLVDEIGAAVGEQLRKVHVDARPGEVRHSLADLTRARDLLSYEPRVTLADGLTRTVASFREADLSERERLARILG